MLPSSHYLDHYQSSSNYGSLQLSERMPLPDDIQSSELQKVFNSNQANYKIVKEKYDDIIEKIDRHTKQFEALEATAGQFFNQTTELSNALILRLKDPKSSSSETKLTIKLQQQFNSISKQFSEAQAALLAMQSKRSALFVQRKEILSEYLEAHEKLWSIVKPQTNPQFLSLPVKSQAATSSSSQDVDLMEIEVSPKVKSIEMKEENVVNKLMYLKNRILSEKEKEVIYGDNKKRSNIPSEDEPNAKKTKK